MLVQIPVIAFLVAHPFYLSLLTISLYLFDFGRVDCGIFAVKFMELWDKNIDLRHILDQSDIPNIRVKLAVDLFFSKWNSIDKSLVVNLYKQVLWLFFCTASWLCVSSVCLFLKFLTHSFFLQGINLMSVLSFFGNFGNLFWEFTDVHVLTFLHGWEIWCIGVKIYVKHLHFSHVLQILYEANMKFYNTYSIII